jgi:NADH-quinone oxidoreductase subunit I
MGGIRGYFGNIAGALTTTVKGMGVTIRHMGRDAITVQYPHARLPLPPSYRGIHILEQEKCIDCRLCAKACPVDCIEIEAVHHGRVLEWQKFSIDYKKCIFCEFCIPPCPKDCIHLAAEYEAATEDPSSMIEDLLLWTGLRAEDKREIEAADAKKSGRTPPPMPEGGRPGGPAPGNPSPFGTQTATTAEPGGPAAPGGLPKRAPAAPAKAPARPAAGARPAAAGNAAGDAGPAAAKPAPAQQPGPGKAPAGGTPAKPAGDMAARIAAIKARMDKDKGQG